VPLMNDTPDGNLVGLQLRCGTATYGRLCLAKFDPGRGTSDGVRGCTVSGLRQGEQPLISPRGVVAHNTPTHP
jgi:hypothetical protein